MAVEFYFSILEEQRSPPGKDTTDPVVAAQPAGIDSPLRDGQRSWRRRHSIRAGRDGGALPELVFWRHADKIAVGWQADEKPVVGLTVRFLETGREDIEHLELQERILVFLDAVSQRIGDDNQDPRARAFLDNVASIRTLSGLDRRRRTAIARLGLEGEEVDDSIREAIDNLALQEGFALQALLLDCATPEQLEKDMKWASKVEHRLRSPRQLSHQNGLHRLRVSARDLQPTGRRPWDLGWSRAKAVRKRFLQDSDNKLCVAPSTLWEQTMRSQVIGSADEEIDTVEAWFEESIPRVVFARKYSSEAKRFRLARAFHDFLFESQPGQPFLKIASPRLPHQLSTGNAFATELLAPVDLVQQELPKKSAFAAEDISRVAKKLRVSSRVVEHQIENHQLGTVMPA